LKPQPRSFKVQQYPFFHFTTFSEKSKYFVALFLTKMGTFYTEGVKKAKNIFLFRFAPQRLENPRRLLYNIKYSGMLYSASFFLVFFTDFYILS